MYKVEKMEEYAELFYCIDKASGEKIVVKHIFSPDQFAYEKLVQLKLATRLGINQFTQGKEEKE